MEQAKLEYALEINKKLQ